MLSISRLVLALAAVSAIALCACPGSLRDPERFEADCEGGSCGSSGPCPDIPSTLFVPTCGVAGCHASTAPQNGVDLISPGVYARLEEQTTADGPVIDTGTPSQSVLYRVLLADTPPGGSRMPFGQAPLDDATVACVLDWIQAGNVDAAP